MSSMLHINGYAVSPDHYINGQRVASSNTFELCSPIDQRVLGQISEASNAQVSDAVAAASAAFPTWAALTAVQRKPYLA
jgi:acyl-CoA reductase-like NAD-dependent aldehyde dehydrogenase